MNGLVRGTYQGTNSDGLGTVTVNRRLAASGNINAYNGLLGVTLTPGQIVWLLPEDTSGSPTYVIVAAYNIIGVVIATDPSLPPGSNTYAVLMLLAVAAARVRDTAHATLSLVASGIAAKKAGT